MANNFKVAKDAQGHVTACGPNDSNFEPNIPPGGTLELSDVFQEVFVPPAAQAKIDRRNGILADAEADAFTSKLRDSTHQELKDMAQNHQAMQAFTAPQRAIIGKLMIALAYALQGGRAK